jgi:BirA family biotin operon repressor/biotin-[acetyl-CoA-carboxylase] ligase
VPPAEAARWSFVVGLAVADTVAAIGGGVARCKWPNDVLIDGAKIAGILLEAGPAAGGIVPWLVAGIGLNVAWHPADAAYPVTSLAARGIVTAPDTVLAGLLDDLRRRADQAREEGFAAIRRDWLAMAHGLGGSITARFGDRETLHGLFTGLDEDGALLLSLPDGAMRRITAGDVYFPDHSDAGSRPGA